MKFPRNRAVLAFLLLNLLAGVLFVGGALLVSFMRSFGTTPAQLGLLLGAGWGASVFGALAGGHLADSIGPRKTILLSITLIALGLLGKALSRHWLQAGAWYLLGMGAQAVFSPAGRALLKAVVGDEVGSSLGFLNATLSATGIPGAALSGWIVGRWGWPSLFIGKFAIYLVALSLLFLLLPEVIAEVKGHGEKARWQDALSSQALLWVCISVFVLTTGAYCHSFYPYFVQERFAADVQALALFDSIYNAVWMLSNWPAGLLADRVGRGRVATIGYALMGTGWLLFPLAPLLPTTYLVYALYCLGNSMGFYASVFAMDVAAGAIKGRAAGLFDAAMYLGSSVGDGVGGLLWQRLGARFSFALAALANFLGSLLLFWAGKHRASVDETKGTGHSAYL